MGDIYLSPAFSRHAGKELDFLYSLDGATGFSLFWIDVVKPFLCAMKAKQLLEIGGDCGEHTHLLLQYCDAFDAQLIVIEPFVKQDLQKIIDNSGRISLMEEKSQSGIPKVDTPIDAVFLEGDLNYHTTYGDLADIEQMAKRQQMPFPLVFFRSGWPYARRDMYYDPTNLPTATITPTAEWIAKNTARQTHSKRSR